MVYFLAHIRIHDTEEYQQYLDETDGVFARFNGTYLAVDQNPDVMEGCWEGGRMVLIQFPSEADLRRWYDSPEYQGILKHRLKAADCDSLLIHGLQQQT